MMNPEQLQRALGLLQQSPQQVLEDGRAQSGGTPAYFALDPANAAKQMAALNATSQHRRASLSGGTSDTLFGPRQPPFDSVTDPVAATNAQVARVSGASAQVLKSRRDEFLKFVANVMIARHTPLPQSITGIPSSYDPNTSRWKTIEPTAEPGGFRLAGKDVDLFKLWQLVLSQGGHAKLTRESTWGALLPHFGLSEELPDQTNGSTSIAHILARYYMALLAPFEEAYLRNVQQQQNKVIQARQHQQQTHPLQSTPQSNESLSSAVSTSQGVASSPPQLISMDASQPANTGSFTELDSNPSTSTNLDLVQRASNPTGQPTSSASDMTRVAPSGESRDRSASVASHVGGETEGRKRKFQDDEPGKRARQKTSTPGISQENESVTGLHQASTQPDAQPQIVPPQDHAHSPARPATANHSRQQLRLRRKIEYVPVARELDTYGGRNLDLVDTEMAKVTSRRQQRPIDEWGTVDIDGLTMSLRSRLPNEMTYALTVLSMLSTMRGQNPDLGFSLQQCDDLLDELLDLLREQAFGDAKWTTTHAESETFWTHRDLVNFVHDQELQIFSDEHRIRGAGASNARPVPKPTPADIISIVLNLLRNFSLTGENQRFMGQHPDVLNLLLHVSSISAPLMSAKDRPPTPTSPVLTLSELVKVRRDVLTIVSNLVPFTNLALHPPHILTQLFELLASFLVEPHDLSSPSGIVIQSGTHNAGSTRPPLVIDLALEAFSKLAQPDTNRFALSRGVKLSWLWCLFGSLVHRLPVSSEDFAITMRMHDVWLSYVEKVVLSIYSICFLATPELKAKIRNDHTLGFPKLTLRMIKRFVSINHADARQYFLVSSRRAVEALKLIDDGGDAFETPQSNAPLFAFGMGFGESDTKQAETGMGLLAGFQEDVTWNIMMMNHLDDVMFAELDSLSRIGV